MLFIFQELDHQYILVNKIKVKQFKENRPGLTWMKNFMKHNKLSHKKAEKISSARKVNTSNPFIIYYFYNLIDEV